MEIGEKTRLAKDSEFEGSAERWWFKEISRFSITYDSGAPTVFA
jgi:hypothetical protein